MVTSSTRELDPRERRVLQKTVARLRSESRGYRLGNIIPWTIWFVSGLLLGFIFYAILAAAEKALELDAPPVVLLLLFAVCMVPGLWVAWRIARPPSGPGRGIESVRADLRDGQAEVIECISDRAVHVPESEDEGHSYFLDVGDGYLFFVSGQYLDQAVLDGRMPNGHMRLVRAPKSKMTLAFECLGHTLTVKGTYVPGPETVLPDDCTLFPGDLTDLQGSLARLQTTRRHA